MKKSSSRQKPLSFGRIAALLLAVVVAVGFVACAQTEVDPGTSGETHFLNTCTNGCGGGLKCACDVCTTDCNVDADCARFGAAAKCVTSCATEKKSCDVPCTADPDCTALGSGYVCDLGVCRKAVASPDAGKDGFASCQIPPLSTCTYAETCKVLDCGGFQYDVQGCQRAACSTDDGCGSDERCTSLGCKDATTCSYDTGRCTCAAPTDCTEASYCNSIATVGPRGDWVSLEMSDTTHNGDVTDTCSVCSTIWNISSDGEITRTSADRRADGGVWGSSDPISSQVSVSVLRALRDLVNGPDLRAALRDGSPCTDPVVSDESIQLTLTLSSQTLSRDVTRCVHTGQSTDNVFYDVYRLLSVY